VSKPDDIRAGLVEWQAKVDALQHDLEATRQELERLYTDPLLPKQFAETMFARAAELGEKAFRRNLDRELQVGVVHPLGLEDSSWAPALLSPYGRPDITNPHIVLYLLRDHLGDQVKAAIAEWAKDLNHGPTLEERQKRIPGLEKKRDELEAKLKAEIQAARDASADLGAIANRSGGKRDRATSQAEE